MRVFRSFALPGNAAEAEITAPVTEWLGVVPILMPPGSFVLMAVVEEAEKPSNAAILRPDGGKAMPSWPADTATWVVQVRYEGQEKPEAGTHTGDLPAQHLGAVMTPRGPAHFFVGRK